MIARHELLAVRRLASRANPRIKDWAGLGDRAERERQGLTVAEGARLVREGLQAGESGLFRPTALLVSDSGAERPEAGELFAAAGRLGVERFSLTDEVCARVSGLKNSDGLLLIMTMKQAPFEPANMWTVHRPRWLMASGVQDPGNAGALARTALAAGATGCIYVDGADPSSPKFLRGSMGACFHLPCFSISAENLLDRWPTEAGTVILATSDEGANFRALDYHSPLAIVIGGERGVHAELAALASQKAHIPLHNGVESLNLAVAAGVILYEAERQWSRYEVSGGTADRPA